VEPAKPPCGRTARLRNIQMEPTQRSAESLTAPRAHLEALDGLGVNDEKSDRDPWGLGGDSRVSSHIGACLGRVHHEWREPQEAA